MSVYSKLRLHYATGLRLPLTKMLKEFVILLSFIKKYTISVSAVLSSKLYWVNSVHTGFDKSDTAFPGADSIQITFWSNTQGCSHRLPSSLQNLHGPFSLLHMLKVLTIKEHKYSSSELYWSFPVAASGICCPQMVNKLLQQQRSHTQSIDKLTHINKVNEPR